jgi:hypothetical protein
VKTDTLKSLYTLRDWRIENNTAGLWWVTICGKNQYKRPRLTYIKGIQKTYKSQRVKKIGNAFSPCQLKTNMLYKDFPSIFAHRYESFLKKKKIFFCPTFFIVENTSNNKTRGNVVLSNHCSANGVWGRRVDSTARSM